MTAQLCVTVDLEQDCPPFMRTYRGMEEGFPELLRLLGEEAVAATFFCTGDVAQRYPDAVHALLAAGHELGCHGMTHSRFTGMSKRQAEAEITTSAEILRGFAQVTSFRAPYLSFPNEFLSLLEREGFTVDSSQGAYKPEARLQGLGRSKLKRIRASVPPSVVRLPAPVRNPWLRMLTSPIVLFFHPWEFVDLRGEKQLPLDCRFATGRAALNSLRETLRFYRERGAAFTTIRNAYA